MYTVLLADDHVLFREGLRGLIQHWDDFEVIGEASNGMEAVEMCEKHIPDLILMDITMPELNGLEATRRIKESYPSTHIVILTVSEEEEDLFGAIMNGAQGYVLKNMPARRLHDMLRGVMLGEAPLSGSIASKVLNEFSQQQKGGDRSSDEFVEPLTDREKEVLCYVAEGLSNKEIAERMYLGEGTVKKYLGNVLDKLQLNNRVQAAVYATQQGLLEEENRID
jgi:two-component system nitrate/nitrite response regulator NarL